MEEERCENCKFFRGRSGEYTGACRRFPPVQAVQEPGEPVRSNTWSPPVVDLYFWCGEFKPIEE